MTQRWGHICQSILSYWIALTLCGNKLCGPIHYDYWRNQATSHTLRQCWPRSMASLGHNVLMMLCQTGTRLPTKAIMSLCSQSIRKVSKIRILLICRPINWNCSKIRNSMRSYDCGLKFNMTDVIFHSSVVWEAFYWQPLSGVIDRIHLAHLKILNHWYNHMLSYVYIQIWY